MTPTKSPTNVLVNLATSNPSAVTVGEQLETITPLWPHPVSNVSVSRAQFNPSTVTVAAPPSTIPDASTGLECELWLHTPTPTDATIFPVGNPINSTLSTIPAR
jgi:hypothetical protein